MADRAIPARPRVRPLEARPAEHQGEQVVVLRDPFKLSPHTAVLSLGGLLIAQLLDGTHTLAEIQHEIARRFGAAIPLEQVEGLVRSLDDALFLEGATFDAAVLGWKHQTVRAPACAGGAYPAEPEALRAFLDEQLTREGGPGGPPARNGAAPVRGIVSPHIDFHRGGHAYAWAWRAVAEACEAEVFVVFGTAHAGTGRARFALTRKDYATPLGTLPTDQELVERLVAAYQGPDDLFEGELSHRGEHSIEFQIVELAHLYSGNRAVRVLPVLCGSIHDLSPGGALPSADPRLGAFHEALAKALEPIAPEKVAFVAGIDLAHVGADFEDPALDEKGLERLLDQDRATLRAAVTEQDPDAVHRDIAQDEGRKICGHSALVATLEALRRERRRGPPLAGELLKHDRWYDGRSTVSFASAVFRPAGGRA